MYKKLLYFLYSEWSNLKYGIILPSLAPSPASCSVISPYLTEAIIIKSYSSFFNSYGAYTFIPLYVLPCFFLSLSRQPVISALSFLIFNRTFLHCFLSQTIIFLSWLSLPGLYPAVILSSIQVFFHQSTDCF